MKFRLVYDGILLGSSNGNPRSQHKHEIRRTFHAQLKALWAIHPYLRDGFPLEEHPLGAFGPGATFISHQMPIAEYLGNRYAAHGYRFAPLVRPELALHCDLDILFLRRQAPGGVVHDGDLDNRLKTIFDALRMPLSQQELGGAAPAADENPFFVLLTDDSLITGVSVKTDDYLSAAELPNGSCRLVIQVDARPFLLVSSNQGFA